MPIKKGTHQNKPHKIGRFEFSKQQLIQVPGYTEIYKITSFCSFQGEGLCNHTTPSILRNNLDRPSQKLSLGENKARYNASYAAHVKMRTKHVGFALDLNLAP